MPRLPVTVVISTERNISNIGEQKKKATCDSGTCINTTRMRELYLKNMPMLYTCSSDSAVLYWHVSYFS